MSQRKLNLNGKMCKVGHLAAERFKWKPMKVQMEMEQLDELWRKLSDIHKIKVKGANFDRV